MSQRLILPSNSVRRFQSKHVGFSSTHRLTRYVINMYILLSRIYSVSSSILVYARNSLVRGRVICAEGLHFSVFVMSRREESRGEFSTPQLAHRHCAASGSHLHYLYRVPSIHLPVCHYTT